MIELKRDSLVFSFPDVHPRCELRIDFQRTLRIPDNEGEYPLPPGIGRFPLRHVDDFARHVPEVWLKHGGVMLPMFQSEALWLNFSSFPYPFAVQVGTGKINAVTGETWREGLSRKPQSYVVAPRQPWLDGYCVERGVIRQFVAMPLGGGYTAEEQIAGKAELGGIQIRVHPMKAEAFERHFAKRARSTTLRECRSPEMVQGAAPDMGLAPGGRMRQEIYKDRYDLDDWDLEHSSRCFVHITNSLVWRAITGENPPTVPPTAREYTKAGLPWFEYYGADDTPMEGSAILNSLKSVLQLGKTKNEAPLPENESAQPKNVIALRAGLTKAQVREGYF
jgi:hypothetical protein